MNSTQSFGVALVIIGLVLLTVFPVFGIAAGEYFIEVTIVGGWAITLVGAGIVIASLVRERMNDMKKEKFDNNY